MAKAVSGLIGAIKGKVGNLVFQTWKGVQVVKNYAVPANPRSTDQTTQRTKFAWLVSWSRQIYECFIKEYYQQFISGIAQTPWGAHLSYNLTNGVDPDAPLNFGFKPSSNLWWSDFSAELSSDTLTIGWVPETTACNYPLAPEDYLACAIIIDPQDPEKIRLFVGSDNLDDGEYALDVSGFARSTEFYVALVFINSSETDLTKKFSSASLFAEHFTTASS
jgi:hypothetical protein